MRRVSKAWSKQLDAVSARDVSFDLTSGIMRMLRAFQSMDAPTDASPALNFQLMGSAESILEGCQDVADPS